MNTVEGAVSLLQEHAVSLLRQADRHSLCRDDAYDAYQRAIEIFLRRREELDPERVVGWLHVVIRHEAMAVRRARQSLVGPAEADLDAREGRGVPDPQERAEGHERLTRAAEALARLKPQETRALLLKAEGRSYRQIQQATGWSHTKVNRLLTEGRQAFRRRYAGIEAGEECSRWSAVLSAMADGEATSDDVASVGPH
ncbi:MAG TPA: sigma-70 family RNA polymerase sigma factor, partial [Solirubrobacteraceae bacterium]|nr:sigma-70 family RNA polymerase sigma factor [Solirubrobacteraceae bacterium]